MLNAIKQESNYTLTENGALTCLSTQSRVLDLFAQIGAMREASCEELCTLFLRAWAEDADLAVKTLFFARDIRGGLGERRVFRVILAWLAVHEKDTVRKNIPFIAEYGRFDDLLALFGTPCEQDALAFIKAQAEADLAACERGESVSLLAKWLPGVNTSNRQAVRNAKKIARVLHMNDRAYRKALAKLRAQTGILENSLREKDYSFDYEKQPSGAMLKYRKAFLRNDGERYGTFLARVNAGEAKLHADTLYPYEILRPVEPLLCNAMYCEDDREMLTEMVTKMVEQYAANGLDLAKERVALDASWKSLPDYTRGENALVVVDGSGSMYCNENGQGVLPALVALSLGIYFAERNTGAFRNHFITFSETPQLVELKGKDIVEKAMYCASYNEVANTDIRRVFALILRAALKGSMAQSDLPETVYIISDMEFDECTENASATNFAYAKKMYEKHGFRLPRLVFWNVNSRNRQFPVTQNEEGVALVSGCSPQIFNMVTDGILSPYDYMLQVLNSARYTPVAA